MRTAMIVMPRQRPGWPGCGWLTRRSALKLSGYKSEHGGNRQYRQPALSPNGPQFRPLRLRKPLVRSGILHMAARATRDILRMTIQRRELVLMAKTPTTLTIIRSRPLAPDTAPIRRAKSARNTLTNMTTPPLRMTTRSHFLSYHRARESMREVLAVCPNQARITAG